MTGHKGGIQDAHGEGNDGAVGELDDVADAGEAVESGGSSSDVESGTKGDNVLTVLQVAVLLHRGFDRNGWVTEV